MSQSDLTILIPKELPHGQTWGPWRIRHCRAKLEEKYGVSDGCRSSSATTQFDAYAALSETTDCSWLDRIEEADLKKTRLMRSRLSAADIRNILSKKKDIEDALKRVPVDLSLEDEWTVGTWRNVTGLFEVFEMPYVRLGKLTKILFLKRRRLIPMEDSHVMGFLFKGVTVLPQCVIP